MSKIVAVIWNDAFSVFLIRNTGKSKQYSSKRFMHLMNLFEIRYPFGTSQHISSWIDIESVDR